MTFRDFLLGPKHRNPRVEILRRLVVSAFIYLLVPHLLLVTIGNYLLTLYSIQFGLPDYLTALSFFVSVTFAHTVIYGRNLFGLDRAAYAILITIIFLPLDAILKRIFL